MEEQKPLKNKGEPPKFFFLTKGLALSALISAYIIGPLILFGGIGYFIGQYIGHVKISLGISLVIAFLFSNWYLYKKAPDLAKKVKVND